MQLLMPLLVLAITLAVGRLAKGIVFKILRRWVAHSKSNVATIIMRALDGPFMIWVLILGVHLASQSSDLPPRWMNRIAEGLLILWIVSLAIMASRLVGNIIRFYGSGIPGAMPVTTLTQNLAQLGVVILALMVLLNLLGIPIAPILTALGVGGLAVALALQDTLSNLFAGFYVAIARQVRLNDYIKLNTGEEGYVTDITWRSTTIRTLGNNLIIIPNAKLAQAVVTNYYLPEKRLVDPGAGVGELSKRYGQGGARAAGRGYEGGGLDSRAAGRTRRPACVSIRASATRRWASRWDVTWKNSRTSFACGTNCGNAS